MNTSDDFEVAPRGTMAKLAAYEVANRQLRYEADAYKGAANRWKQRCLEAEQLLAELNEQLEVDVS